MPSARHLHLAAPHRRDRAAGDEAPHDVGAARDRGELHVGLDAARTRSRSPRARAASPSRGSSRTRVERVRASRGDEPGFAHGVEELRRRTEHRQPLRVGQVEQRALVGMEGRAVVEHERRARREPRREPVPHHPAAGREVEQPVARAQVAVEQLLLRVLEQRAARAVHDALRRAGRAGRVQDVERMVEGQALERERGARAPARASVPTYARPAASAGPRSAPHEHASRPTAAPRDTSATRAHSRGVLPP